MDDAAPVTTRYSAFISYSHADASFVGRLHRQLESYRLPRRVVTGGNWPPRPACAPGCERRSPAPAT
jgi:hypothetical protein